jgi:hypothetical protein
VLAHARAMHAFDRAREAAAAAPPPTRARVRRRRSDSDAGLGYGAPVYRPAGELRRGVAVAPGCCELCNSVSVTAVKCSTAVSDICMCTSRGGIFRRGRRGIFSGTLTVLVQTCHAARSVNL